MPRKKPEGSEPVKLASLGLENYELVEVVRDQLKGAPYNPRRISDAEKRKLKAGLKQHGLVAPITWNRRTGNIVGGHQRLDQLDSLTGTKNYTLRVAAIDVSDAKEKELCVLLNNPEAQGEWDLEALRGMFDDKSLTLEGMGFDGADLFRIFGEDVTKTDDVDGLDELANKVRSIAQTYDTIRDKNKGKNSEWFYVVVVFRDAADLREYLEDAGLPQNRYQSGAELRRLCGIQEKKFESEPVSS